MSFVPSEHELADDQYADDGDGRQHADDDRAQDAGACGQFSVRPGDFKQLPEQECREADCQKVKEYDDDDSCFHFFSLYRKWRRVVSRRAALVCIPLSPLHHTPFHAERVLFSDGAADSRIVSIAEEAQTIEHKSEPAQKEKELKQAQGQVAAENGSLSTLTKVTIVKVNAGIGSRFRFSHIYQNKIV